MTYGHNQCSVRAVQDRGRLLPHPVSQHEDMLTAIAAGGYAVEVEDFDFAYALYAGDPSNGSSTTRVASFRLGRIGYRLWATRSGRINPSVEDRLDHDVDELMA